MAKLYVQPIRDPVTSGTSFMASVYVAGLIHHVYDSQSPQVALLKLAAMPELTGLSSSIHRVLYGVRTLSVSDADLLSGIEL